MDKNINRGDAPRPDTVGDGAAATTPDSIGSIRKAVELINTEQLRKESFVFTCDEKMMVDYYYYGDDLVKIAVDFGTVGDVYAKEEYYYDEGQLIFIYEFTEGGPACEGCSSKNEYRYYISQNRVFKYVKNADVAPCRKWCNITNHSRHYQLLKASSASEMKNLFCQ